MGLIDTHCHLNFKSFDKDFLEVARRSCQNGIDKIIIVGSDPKTSQIALERAKLINKQLPDFANIAVGIHPTHTDRIDWPAVERLVQDPLTVAIGETGFDFFQKNGKNSENEQAELFKRHIELAIKSDKPLIVHNRLADSEIKSTIENYPDLKKVVFHCFSTDQHFAAWALEKGFYLSFTGNITYGNKKLKKVIERTAIERIMVETDSPYIIPEPERSQGNLEKNEPYLVVEVAKRIAQIKDISEEEVANQTTKNALNLFALK